LFACSPLRLVAALHVYGNPSTSFLKVHFETRRDQHVEATNKLHYAAL
jgi:hypothetical protein